MPFIERVGEGVLLWSAKKGFRSTAVDRIPADQVGRLTQDFSDVGAEEVTVKLEPDGTWTLIARYRETDSA